MTGFIDGINDSLKVLNNIEKLETQTIISLDYDEEILYNNMLESDYDMSVWEGKKSKQSNMDKIKVVKKFQPENLD